MTKPPTPRRVPVNRVFHGDTVTDPYEWLRDKDDPGVIDYLHAQNAYTDQVMTPTADLQKTIFNEIKSRTKETDSSVPFYNRGWWYFARTYEGQAYSSYHRVKADSRPDPDVMTDGEQLLFDQNVLAEGYDFFITSGFEVSPDGRLLALGIDAEGDERFTIRIMEIDSGEVIDEAIVGAGYGMEWSTDSRHLFYGMVDDAWRGHQVWAHRIGESMEGDRLIFEEEDEKYSVHPYTSRDGRWLILHSSSRLTSEVRVMEATPDANPVIVSERRPGLDYTVEPAGDHLLIVHNLSRVDFEVATAPLGASEPESWVPLLAASEGERIEGVSAFARFAVVSMRSDGLPQLRIIPRNDRWGEPFVLPSAELSTIDLANNPDYETETIDYALTSLIQPPSVYSYSVTTGETVLLKERDVPGYDRGQYRTSREWATADDGTQIPLTLAYRADVEPDGTNPGLLYGYGSYEISIDPVFSTSVVSLLDRGVVFAYAHVRGGGEMGRAWYDTGKMLSKKNTFTDFIAAADRLFETGWVDRSRLAAEGGSAGGLLVGAAANMGGDRFRAISAVVPFVDNLTSILDPSLPLTVGEWEEWGDPYHDPDVYEYIKSYSPYENLEAKEYPAILATTSLNDTRVFYVEPAKWISRLQEIATNGPDRPLLLKTEMVAGHGGRSGRYNAWEDQALRRAFILWQLGVGDEQVRL
ncbi:S9 family peptidase [Flaviflexus huanghaiensis]|uniref:S9 family peptidase n=1 Tax=Flaviflexus huanghaiensis TaxID=1111473 RepID=UPI0015F86393|nr:S9 family peptidase [Flaviflexus huanghaiensis]